MGIYFKGMHFLSFMTALIQTVQNSCQLHINDGKSEISGIRMCVSLQIFKCKYIYVLAGEGSINLGTFNTPAMTE